MNIRFFILLLGISALAFSAEATVGDSVRKIANTNLGVIQGKIEGTSVGCSLNVTKGDPSDPYATYQFALHTEIDNIYPSIFARVSLSSTDCVSSYPYAPAPGPICIDSLWAVTSGTIAYDQPFLYMFPGEFKAIIDYDADLLIKSAFAPDHSYKCIFN